MSEKPIGEIVGRHEDGAASETEPRAKSEVAASTTQTVETAGGQEEQPDDPVAAFKGAMSALEKERAERSRIEKEWKKEQREARARAQQIDQLTRNYNELRAKAERPDPNVLENEFWTGKPHEFIGQQVDSRFQTYAQQQFLDRIEEGREAVRDQNEDFDEAEAVFFEAAAKDPSLMNSINALRPMSRARAVYKKGKQLMEGVASTPDGRIAKLEAEIAELRAGRDGGQTSAQVETTAAPAQKPSIPKSNAGLRSSGVGRTSSFAGPTPIEKIYGRQPRTG